mgnify:CR=1 FL=1
MPLFSTNSSTVRPATLEERAASAAATTEAALVVFADAVSDLEQAAADLEELADIHFAESDNHAVSSRDAQEAAQRNRARAAKIREHFTF